MSFTCFPHIHNNGCNFHIILFFQSDSGTRPCHSAIQIFNLTIFQGHVENPIYSFYLKILTLITSAKSFCHTRPYLQYLVIVTWILEEAGIIQPTTESRRPPGCPLPSWAPVSSQEILRHSWSQRCRHVICSPWSFHYSVTIGYSGGYGRGIFYYKVIPTSILQLLGYYTFHGLGS